LTNYSDVRRRGATSFRPTFCALVTGALLLASATSGVTAPSDTERPGYVATEAEEQLSAELRRQMVFFRTTEVPGTIVVHTQERFLYLVQGNNRAIRYGIGVGREGFQWTGLKRIDRKAEGSARGATWLGERSAARSSRDGMQFVQPWPQARWLRSALMLWRPPPRRHAKAAGGDPAAWLAQGGRGEGVPWGCMHNAARIVHEQTNKGSTGYPLA